MVRKKMGKGREKRGEKHKQEKSGEKQEGKEGVNQRKYNYSGIHINESMCIAITFLETLTSLRNIQNY